MKKPYVINLSKIGSSTLGYITVAEELDNVPFEIKRVYWTYFTPHDVQRGGHAHKELEQFIFAVSGVIEFTTEDTSGNKETFILDSPEKGLYIPAKIWRDIKFSHNAVLLCLASEHYVEDDYIRDYNEFKKWK
ncbi:MAG: FdtA/QdtA family cupin domain-containing protein [Flavobacteriaceae bacterium]|jgi:dTDP-4-dehydrorhamnose 3,5-epimerase-like enzyme|nr:FdtA/QdtA family cupin domain-containing protein [Flavobacteriaceae bacterium]